MRRNIIHVGAWWTLEDFELKFQYRRRQCKVGPPTEAQRVTRMCRGRIVEYEGLRLELSKAFIMYPFCDGLTSVRHTNDLGVAPVVVLVVVLAVLVGLVVLDVPADGVVETLGQRAVHDRLDVRGILADA